MCICDLNIDFEKLRSTERVNSALAATVTSHKEWFDIKLIDVKTCPIGFLPAEL